VTDEQAEAVLRELRAIKHTLQAAALAAAVLDLATRALGLAFGP
jgi:hypothetical protein